MTIQDTCLHHKHTREREQLGPNNKSAVTPSEPVEPRTEQDEGDGRGDPHAGASIRQACGRA